MKEFNLPTSVETQRYGKLFSVDAGYVVGEIQLFDSAGRSEWDNAILVRLFEQLDKARMPILERLTLSIPSTEMCWNGLYDTLVAGCALLHDKCHIELKVTSLLDLDVLKFCKHLQLVNPLECVDARADMFEHLATHGPRKLPIDIVTVVSDPSDLNRFSESVEWALWLQREGLNVRQCRIRIHPGAAIKFRDNRDFWLSCNRAVNKQSSKKEIGISMEQSSYLASRVLQNKWLQEIPCSVSTSTFFANYQGDWFHCSLLAYLASTVTDKNIYGNIVNGDTVQDCYDRRELKKMYCGVSICKDICQTHQIALNAEAFKATGSILSLI